MDQKSNKTMISLKKILLEGVEQQLSKIAKKYGIIETWMIIDKIIPRMNN